MDPCDLRLVDGDAAVRELVASRIPLYRFVLDNTLKKFDLDRGDQRIDAIRESVGLATSIRDKSKVEEFIREIAVRVGADVDQVRAELKRSKARPTKGSSRVVVSDQPKVPPQEVVSLGEPQFADEREALKAIVQFPHFARDFAGDLHDNDFTHPFSQELWRHISGLTFPDKPDVGWVSRVSDGLDSEQLKRILSQCAVEPLRSTQDTTHAVVNSLLARLQELTTARRIVEVKSKLQRTNPIEHVDDYNRMFGELVALEQQRRSLRERAIG